MNKWSYYVNDFSFEWPDNEGGYNSYTATFKVNACKDTYGEDADGNRGIPVIDRELVEIEIRDEEGRPVELKPGMEEFLAERVREEGSDLE